MLRASLLCVAAVLFQPSCAVDKSKFRTCDQGSFCRRFKKWIARPDLEEALWRIAEGSRTEAGNGGFAFKVQHKHEQVPHLDFKIDFHDSGVVRFRLNEIDPVSPRHMIPVGDVIDDPPPQGAKAVQVDEKQQGKTIFSFTTSDGATVDTTLHHVPLRLEVAVNGRVVQVVNSRNFLNFERYRVPKSIRPPDAAASLPGANDLTLDAAQHPHDLDTDGLWEESFGGHTDKKPRGPASFGLDVTFPGEIPSVFGLPEHATKVNLPFFDEPYRFYNLDVFEYELDVPMALYGTIPILWAIQRGEKPGVSAFLWINPSETFVKLERDAGKAQGHGPVHSWWVSESGVMDAAIFVGPTPEAVSAQFHALTGHAPIPPMWALGKHQCRWNYQNEKDVATVDASYDKHDIPYDVIWLDIEHTDGKAYFSWHENYFPTPEKMTDAISAKKRKMVLVVDPHIKKSDTFDVYKEIRDKELFVKKVDWKMLDDPSDHKPEDWCDIEQIADPEASQPEEWNTEDDGAWEPPKIANPDYKGSWKAKQITDPNSPKSNFEGWCWPGTSLYPDFADPAMREYWGSRFALDKYKGTNKDTFIWNDMNEPSVFNGPEVTMPRDAVHPHGNVEHRDLHNMYGYYVHRATFEGLAKRTPGDRPFVLTRSFFIGSHKYCAIWTGDNTAEWGHIGISVGMVLHLNLGGQSLVGADVGGFFKHPDGAMVTRWYQLAALGYGFFRNHAHLETPRREPYMYDDDVMARVKEAIQLRYQLLPLWYTLFERYHRLGHPVVRPLFWNFLDDPDTHTDFDAVENQLMVGGTILVHAVSNPDQESAQVYLPKGAGWYDLHTGDYYAPGKYTIQLTMDSIPAFFTAGSIVPTKSRVRRSSSCMVQDPHTLSVYLDPETGLAGGSLYLDDQETLAYQDGKSFLDFALKMKEGSLTADVARGDGFEGDISAEVERVHFFGLKEEPKSAEFVDKSGVKRELVVISSHEIVSTGRPGKLFEATVKVVPFISLIDLKEGASLRLL